jgi:hypothetical protein
MRRIGVFALLFLFSLCTATGFAQNATTSLRGVVKDPSGAVVPGATISLSVPATGQKFTATSKGSGEYQLQQIPPAKYVITVTAPGFGSESKSAELLVNQPATIDFALTVMGSSEVVDVTEAKSAMCRICSRCSPAFFFCRRIIRAGRAQSTAAVLTREILRLTVLTIMTK